MVWRVPGKFQTVADEVKLPRCGGCEGSGMVPDF